MRSPAQQKGTESDPPPAPEEDALDKDQVVPRMPDAQDILEPRVLMQAVLFGYHILSASIWGASVGHDSFRFFSLLAYLHSA